MEGGFKLRDQMENLEPVLSQLPRLSSFNIGKMAQTAKLNYTLEEAMASPAVMMDILNSLPDETEGMQASGGALDDEDSKSSLIARQELKADMRQTLIILDDIMRKMAEMTGHPLPDPMKPLKTATQSTVEKLPPITNQYLTAAPLEWGSEKKSSSSDSDSASLKKAKADEVVKDGVVVAINRKCTTCGRDDSEVVSVSVATTEKAAAEKAAAEKAAAEKAAAQKIAAEKAARKAKIQAKIAELERTMQVEMQKLKQMDQEPDTAPVESEVEKMKKQAEHEQKMAEYDQIIESAKEYRIAQVEAAKKERQEALRIAELERAQQEKMKAKLANEKQAKMGAKSEAEKLRKRAEYDQKMAEFDRIIENSMEYRIAQVEAAMKERQEALRIAELERAQQEKKEAKFAQKKQAKVEANVAWEMNDEIEAKLAKELREEMEARLAMEKQAQLEAKLAKEKQAEEEARLAKEKQTEEEARLAKEKQAEEEARLAKKKQAELASLAEKQAQMAEYDRIINAATDHRITMVEKAKQERLAELEQAKNAEEEARLARALQVEKEAKIAKEKQAEMEAKLAKEKQAQMAEYDRIINTMTDYRIAMVEKAKREKEEARLAAMDEVKRAEEKARLASMMSPKVDKAEEEAKLAKEKQAETEAKLAKEKQAEEEAKKIKQAEKHAQMAEYDCIINAATDYRIAMVEKAKREKEEARLAAMDETKRAEEMARLASMMSPKIDKAEESQSGEVIEGDSKQAAEEVEEEIPEQQDVDGDDDDLVELQKSYVQPTRSRPRPPTPPAGHPPMHHSHTSLFGAQMSLRTINEGGGACDFTPEFASPLITHSMHAVVPYMSLRTRLGLRQTEMMTDKELGEEMRRLSEASLVIKKEIMKRKLSTEQVADVSQSVIMTCLRFLLRHLYMHSRVATVRLLKKRLLQDWHERNQRFSVSLQSPISL